LALSMAVFLYKKNYLLYIYITPYLGPELIKFENRVSQVCL
jgi:hypothetical protein